ncbi:MAG: undecaprenyl-diphosphate phosphatase [Actinobacteria bacterium]|uniref:Undecaprenyl-diphosphatase n=1 Tax=freshwater metagenome TaxID=449393 RepID=A0A6J7A5Y4_9ZZZZ|nr:undecaprenyl-diphosphate phosphatase [Actinomycetota bacterium]MSW91344.1 undecaprenyl-diphosphate phosphatase [Actinomycetota bacterium]MSX86907.1 undecaprenyl-diphosphate phosphatase [Actinomycetota bacterium]
MKTRWPKVVAVCILVVAAVFAIAFDRTRDPSPTRPTLVDASIFGVVEGITEFLPISSTGHLLVADRVLAVGRDDRTKDAADTFTVFIQTGAMFAVLWLYRRRFESLTLGVLGRDAEGRRIAGLLAVSFLPAAVVAFAFGDRIKAELFKPGSVAIAWVVGGLAMIGLRWVRRANIGVRTLAGVGRRDALIIGLSQCIALWPGVSRSLVTIVAALLCGLSLATAVEYSFLLGAVTLTAAGVYESGTNGSMLIDVFGWAPLVVGLLFAFAAAVVSIQWLLDRLRPSTFVGFGCYRVAAGVLVVVLVLAGVW